MWIFRISAESHENTNKVPFNSNSFSLFWCFSNVLKCWKLREMRFYANGLVVHHICSPLEEALVAKTCALLAAMHLFNSCSFTHSINHGHNLVGDTGNVSPHFFRPGGHNMPCPSHFFLFMFCIWRGFKNKSDVCHVLCEELFMLDGGPHIAKLMLKQSLVWY